MFCMCRLQLRLYQAVELAHLQKEGDLEETGVQEIFQAGTLIL